MSDDEEAFHDVLDPPGASSEFTDTDEFIGGAYGRKRYIELRRPSRSPKPRVPGFRPTMQDLALSLESIQLQLRKLDSRVDSLSSLQGTPGSATGPRRTQRGGEFRSGAESRRGSDRQLWVKLFNILDKDQDGRLTRLEIIKRMQKAVQAHDDALLREIRDALGLAGTLDQEDGTRDAFEAIFHAIDTDDDRTISLEEFCTFLEARCSKGRSARGPSSSGALSAGYQEDFTEHDPETVVVNAGDMLLLEAEVLEDHTTSVPNKGFMIGNPCLARCGLESHLTAQVTNTYEQPFRVVTSSVSVSGGILEMPRLRVPNHSHAPIS